MSKLHIRLKLQISYSSTVESEHDGASRKNSERQSTLSPSGMHLRKSSERADPLAVASTGQPILAAARKVRQLWQCLAGFREDRSHDCTSRSVKRHADSFEKVDPFEFLLSEAFRENVPCSLPCLFLFFVDFFNAFGLFASRGWTEKAGT